MNFPYLLHILLLRRKSEFIEHFKNNSSYPSSLNLSYVKFKDSNDIKNVPLKELREGRRGKGRRYRIHEMERTRGRGRAKKHFVVPNAGREYQNGKRLVSINHFYSGPLTQVTARVCMCVCVREHYVNQRVFPFLSFLLSRFRVRAPVQSTANRSIGS